MAPAQKRLFILDSLEEEKTHYNLPAVFEVSGEMNKQRLQQVWQQLIRRHEALRTTFALENGEPVQRIGEEASFAVKEQQVGTRAQAQQLASQLQTEWNTVQAQVSAATAGGHAPRALFVLSHSGTPQVAGGNTAGNALLQLGGATNVMQGFNGYRPLTAEAMAQAAPQVIVTTTQGIEAVGGEAKFWARPELALTPAYKARRLIALEASQLLGFGPRLPQAVQTLHQGLQAIKA